jgi:hypothetical protein
MPQAYDLNHHAFTTAAHDAGASSVAVLDPQQLK